MTALNYKNAPWAHPAVWPTHLARTTYAAGVATVTCECGWAVCARITSAGGFYVALDDAKEEHWLAVIAEAESVPA
jgi:hypothetical protein